MKKTLKKLTNADTVNQSNPHTWKIVSTPCRNPIKEYDLKTYFKCSDVTLYVKLCTPVTFRRHEATDGSTHADDARTPTHDASSSTDDDASQAGHDATRQIRASGFPPFFVAMNRLCLVRTLSLTLGFISAVFEIVSFTLKLQSLM